MFKVYGQYHTLINDFAANDHEQQDKKGKLAEEKPETQI